MAENLKTEDLQHLHYFWQSASGAQMGPSDLEQLKREWKAKTLHSHCHIFGDGFADWITIDSIPALHKLIEPPPPPPPNQKPKPPPPRSAPSKAPPPPPREKKKSTVKLAQGWCKKLTCDQVPYYYHTVTQQLTWNTPEELISSLETKSSGGFEWFWVPDEVQGWVAAKAVGGGSYERQDGGSYKPKRGETAPLELNYSALARLQDDLVLLDSLDEGLVLHNLKERFNRDEIYTAVGGILIAFNPFKRLPLYGNERIEIYHKAGNKPMPPHPYKLAAAAHRALLDEECNQSILVSGESGAGKTEATKQCLSYLAEVAGSNTTNIEQRVLSANPILEAFGNAKTTRNDNSSRFGRFTEVQMDKQLRICGAKLTNYLLEKSRVKGQSEDERNYHAFYHLCASPDAAQYGLRSASDYEYLTKCLTVPSIDDAAEFADVVTAMDTLSFDEAAQKSIFSILAAILKIGTTRFSPLAATSQSDGSRVDSQHEADLRKAAENLGVPPDALGEALTHRTLQIRGQDDMKVSLRVEQSMENRDALAKYVYDNLFNWLVQRVNDALEAEASEVKRYIGILDIFGFEIFKINSFEQLCINFTNEKLQQLFNEHTFKSEEDVYRSEGVPFPPIAFIDNQPIVDLIEKRGGILTVLDDTVKGPGKPEQKDTKFSTTMDSTCGGGKNAFYVAANEHRGVQGRVFSVRHYAGVVCYSCAGFVEKNADTLYKDLYDCMSASSNALVAKIFPKVAEEVNKKETLGAAFRKQVAALMCKLRETAPHYIRCVKPNQLKRARLCDGSATLEQLRCAGVFEAVKIRKQGFPFRFEYARFVARYKSIMSTVSGWIPLKGATPQAQCEEILVVSKQKFEKLQRGRTMLLFRADEYRVLELSRALAADRVASKIEAIGRGNLTRAYLVKIASCRPKLAAALKSGDPDDLEEALRLTDEALGVFAGFEVAVPIAEWAEAKRIVRYVKEAHRLAAMLEVAAAPTDMELVKNPAKFEALFGVITGDCAELAQRLPITPIFDQWYAYANALFQRSREGIMGPKVASVMNELEREAMTELYTEAKRWGYVTPALREIEKLLKVDEETLLKRQYQKACETGQGERAIQKEIQLKEVYLDQYAPMFVFENAAVLRHPDEYANAATMFSSNKQERVKTMLQYSKLRLLTSLTRLDPNVTRDALRVNKSIMGYMGDVRTYASEDLCAEVVSVGLHLLEIRPEIYCQLMKQLTNNPNPESKAKGWHLTLMCLLCFPPEAEIENYLHIFLRNYAPPHLKVVLAKAAHAITYVDKLLREPPGVEDLAVMLADAIANKDQNTGQQVFRRSNPR